jgi:hypothetical protein
MMINYSKELDTNHHQWQHPNITRGSPIVTPTRRKYQEHAETIRIPVSI